MKTIITEIPDYKSHIKGTETMNVGYPWLTFGAIMALEHIMESEEAKGFNVLEEGSGGSTIFFAKYCKFVLSLETDQDWYNLVYNKVSHNKNVFMVHGNLKKLLDVVHNEQDEFFDIILADAGPDYNIRQLLLDNSITKLKQGGWLIIDNYENVKFDYTGFDVYTFDGFRHSGRGTRLCKKL